MSKFKAGDKVRVISAASAVFWYAKNIGEVFTLYEQNESLITAWRVLGRAPSLLHEVDIELIEREGARMNFKKSDLKEGMKVVFRNEIAAFVHTSLEELWDVNDHDVYYLTDWNESLDDSGNTGNWDVVEVYAIGELIWRREGESPAQKKLKELEATIKQLEQQRKELMEVL